MHSTRSVKDRIKGAAHKTKKVTAEIVQDVGKGLVKVGQGVKKEGELLADNAKHDTDGMRDIEKGNAHLEKASKYYAKGTEKQAISWFSFCRPCCAEESDSEEEAFISNRNLL